MTHSHVEYLASLCPKAGDATDNTSICDRYGSSLVAWARRYEYFNHVLLAQHMSSEPHPTAGIKCQAGSQTCRRVQRGLIDVVVCPQHFSGGSQAQHWPLNELGTVRLLTNNVPRILNFSSSLTSVFLVNKWTTYFHCNHKEFKDNSY